MNVESCALVCGPEIEFTSKTKFAFFDICIIFGLLVLCIVKLAASFVL